MDSSDSDEFPHIMRDDQDSDSSDSSIGSRSKEDDDSSKAGNFALLRRQLFVTDSEEARVSGQRKAVDQFMKDPKLGHKTCLLCGTNFTKKKSLYRHYRARKPCRERLTEKPKKLKRFKTKTGKLKSISILLLICYVNRLIHELFDCLIGCIFDQMIGS